MVNVQPSEARQCSCSLLWFALLDQVTWGLGQENHTDEDDDGPRELYRNGNAIATCVVSILARVAHNGCKEQTNRDSPLICTDNAPSDPLGSRLRLVEGNCFQSVSWTDRMTVIRRTHSWQKSCRHRTQRRSDQRRKEGLLWL